MRRLEALARSRGASLAIVLLVALVFFLAKPVVFVGGESDDQRYLDAARAWAAHGPVVGTLHWDLRHPLVLPLALSIRLFGEGAFGLLLVPVAYALALLAIGVMVLRARIDAATALLWGLFFATNPLIHELATRIYPDLGEAFFVVASLAAVDAAARAGGGRRIALLLTAGVTASLAMLMRETSFFLALVYAGCFLAGRPMRRRDWIVVAFGAVPLLAIETIWLWAATGDPLYRIHVALHHVDIPSNHMAGKVFTGSVIFNPALASRWIAPGPIDVHWTVNPLLYFFLDPFYGGAAILALLLAVATRGAPAIAPDRRRFVGRCAAIGGAAFVFVTYVLMVSQRPRYYVLALLAAMLVGAVLAVRGWPYRRRVVAGLVALQIVVSLVIIGVRHVAHRGLPTAPAISRNAAASASAPFRRTM